MIAESTAAVKVAVRWFVTSFRFAAGYLRIFWRAASLWLPRRMGFDILMPLSGIDALVGAIARKPSGPDLWQRRTTGNRLGRVAR